MRFICCRFYKIRVLHTLVVLKSRTGIKNPRGRRQSAEQQDASEVMSHFDIMHIINTHKRCMCDTCDIIQINTYKNKDGGALNKINITIR